MSGDGTPDSSYGEASSSFASFAERLRSCENDAAEELLSRYSTQLVALARRRLGPQLALKVDPQDVLQSVFRTFFRRLGSGQIELRDWTSLMGLLSVLTLRKCCRQVRRFSTAGRDARLEVAFVDGTGSLDVLVPDRAPTPEEVAAFTDLLERLLACLSVTDREVITLLFAGESVASAACRLGRSRRTVQRRLVRVRRLLLDDPDLAVAAARTASVLPEA